MVVSPKSEIMRSITDWKTDKMKVVPAELSNVACHAKPSKVEIKVIILEKRPS